VNHVKKKACGLSAIERDRQGEIRMPAVVGAAWWDLISRRNRVMIFLDIVNISLLSWQISISIKKGSEF